MRRLDLDDLFARSRRGPDECWPWAGAVSKNGYGTAGTAGTAHRIAWEREHGPIPDGLTIDHLTDRCTRRDCVNPAHMEPVTRTVNAMRGQSPIAQNARKDRCAKEGHPLTGDNLIIRARTGRASTRECRACKRVSEHRRYHARRTPTS